MAHALEDGLPRHLRRNIEAALNGKRDFFKPPPHKNAPSLSIPLTPADLEPEFSPLSGSGGSSLCGDGRRGIPYGDVPSPWSGSYSSGPPCASSLRSSGPAPSLEKLIESPPSGPAILGAARRVGRTWVRQQEREWYRGQLAKREERVQAEAERLFLATIGPLGMSLDMWHKWEGKVEALALHNVQRQEALELYRMRIQEWGARAVSDSSAAAVRTALSAAIEDSGAGGEGGQEGGTISGGGDVRDGGRRRCSSALPNRYMETNLERTRIRIAMDQLAAKHASAALLPSESFTRAPSPRSHTDGIHSNISLALELDEPHGQGTRMPRKSRLASGLGGAGGNNVVGAEGRMSSLDTLQALRARRESQWASETHAIAARVSAFMSVESPVSPRVAMAAASHRGSSPSRVSFAMASAPRPSSDGAVEGASFAHRRRRSAVKSDCNGSGHEAGNGSSAGTDGTSSCVVSSNAQGEGLRGPISANPSIQPPRLSYATRTSPASPSPSPPSVAPGRQQLQSLPQEELELANMTPEEAEMAIRLVNLYREACGRHRLHPEAGLCAALRRSCAPVQSDPRSRVLDLAALTLTGREAAEALAEVLTSCTHVNAVTLDRCAVGVEALGVVLGALWRLPLRRLSTTSTDFPPATWPLLQRALGRPTVWGTEATWWLSLRHLSLAGNGLADQGLCALVEVLIAMPSLQCLALRQCGMSDLSAPLLEKLMGELTALTELDLGYNNLGIRAVGALARGLPKATKLRRLSLPWNSVGGGVAALCWTVMKLGPRHCRLEVMDLAGTDLVEEDLFALAAILRSWPKTCVRHINLSHNNLVGVAGQCLLRHMNHLSLVNQQHLYGRQQQGQQQGQQQRQGTEGADGPGSGKRSDSDRVDGGGGGGTTAATAFTTQASPISGGGAVSCVAFRPTSLEGGGGSGSSTAVAKALVPILKVPGSPGQPAKVDSSTIKRLTININPVSAASPLSLPPAVATPYMSYDDSLSCRPSSASSFSATVVAAVAAAAADRTAASRAPAATGAVFAKGDAITVVTAGCVVEPSLPPGVQLRVHPDGRPLFPTYSEGVGDDDDDSASQYGGMDERERQREREREQQRAREREERLAAQQQPSQQLPQPPEESTGSGRLGARWAGVVTGAAVSAVTAVKTSTASVAGDQAVVLSDASGPHSHSLMSHLRLDLSSELPGRQVVALLVEHEAEARRHGYRSVFRGVKWQGGVYKRDGVELSPLDPVYLGWTHLLPRVGVLELLVAALPPQLCPWLGNPLLECNATEQMS